MKLQLSVFAQDLVAEGVCDPFAVVAELHSEEGKDPTVIGRTEVLKNSKSPDWTKIFILNYDLGRPMHILVTIQDENSNKSLGSAIFEVGSVLGTKGGILGKEIKSGGIILANVERSSGSGTLNFKMRGVGMLSKQEKIDPFFELQRKRTSVSGDIVWDTVFRSRPIMDDANPVWDDCCVELSTLTGGKKTQKFRVAVKDYDENDKHTLIGYFRVSVKDRVSVKELLSKVTSGADTNDVSDINMDNAIVVAKGKDTKRQEVGHIIVVSASVGDDTVTDEDQEPVVEAESRDFRGDDDIVIEATDDIELVPDELVGGPCFADYISGGCQLRVIVAIDFTASNGDPRKEDSLHYFKKDGMNQYQTSISMICNILSEYDSDQKYPVWGFGAKRNGKLDHCFRCGQEEEAEGVDGILDSYTGAFKSGIAMSSPTDITEVIRAAGKNARESLSVGLESGSQGYSLLAIFTNGNVHSTAATIEALDAVKEDPVSIVVVGVGPSDFGDMKFLNEDGQSSNGRVHFVDMKSHQGEGNSLTEATLKDIPQHLVDYFVGKGIQPNPPLPPDDIVIEPFTEDGQVEANVVVSESGTIEVTSDAKPPDATDAGSGRFGFLGKKAKEEMMKQGNRILARQKKKFGKIQKDMQRKMDKMIDQQIKQTFKF